MTSTLVRLSNHLEFANYNQQNHLEDTTTLVTLDIQITMPSSSSGVLTVNSCFVGNSFVASYILIAVTAKFTMVTIDLVTVLEMEFTIDLVEH